MKKIYIKTTEACNLHCKHCYIGDNRRKKDFFDEIKTINWLKGRIGEGKDCLISFHGGEPFLCDLNKMAKLCDSFPAAEFDATSNLCFSSDEYINKLISFIKKYFIRNSTDRPFVKTSWDHKIRFATESEEETWKKNIKKLLSEGIDVKVITCLTKDFITNITPEAYRTYMMDLGIKELDFERLTANSTPDKTLLPDYEAVDQWLLSFYECNTDFEVGMFANMSAAACGTFVDCRARKCMQNTITINADGTIGGCPNSSIHEWFYNIDGKSNHQMHKQLIQKECVRNPQCYTCDLFMVCNGDCHQLSWQGNTCPEPKRLLRRIINDVERGKTTLVFNA